MIKAKHKEMTKNKIRKKRMIVEDLQLYSLCVIPVVMLVLFRYVPMAGIIMAFKNYRYDKGIFGSEWVGLQNFKVFLSGGEFPRLVRNTLGINFMCIVVGIMAAMALAILMFNVVGKYKVKTYQTIFILPHFISWVMVAYVVYTLLAPNEGIFNNILKTIGREPVDWYAKPELWPAILVICNTWKVVGMNSIYYYSSLIGIDSTLFEAADVDGATSWQKIRYVMIPSMVPIVTILFIMSIGGIFGGDFGLFYQVPKNIGALYETTDVITTYNFRVMKVMHNMGLGTAISLFQSLIGITLVLITNALSKKVDSSLGLF